MRTSRSFRTRSLRAHRVAALAEIRQPDALLPARPRRAGRASASPRRDLAKVQALDQRAQEIGLTRRSAQHRRQLHHRRHQSLRRAADQVHRLRRLRHRLQLRRQEHALHELPADGRRTAARRSSPRPRSSGSRSSTAAAGASTASYVERPGKEEKFTLDAENVILSAGSAEFHRDPAALGDARPEGLAGAGHRLQRQRRLLRPGVQRRFRDRRPRLRHQPRSPRRAKRHAPGPTIVSAIRYNEPAGGRALRHRGPVASPAPSSAPPKPFFAALDAAKTPTPAMKPRERERVRRDVSRARIATSPTARSTTPCSTW